MFLIVCSVLVLQELAVRKKSYNSSGKCTKILDNTLDYNLTTMNEENPHENLGL